MSGNSEAAPPTPPPPARRRLGLALLLLNACVFLLAHEAAFRLPLCANDDVRQQIFWMRQWRDASPPSPDLLIDYARAYVPWGVKGLYWIAARAIDPLLFSKILPGLLFVSLGMLLFSLGRRLAGPAAGACAVGAYWLTPFFLDQLAGGLAHSFAAPLLALFALGWLERRPGVVGAALLLQALFIPYLTPVCAGAALLPRAVPRRWRGDAWVWPTTWTQSTALAAAIALALAWARTLDGAGLGPWANARELSSLPELSAAGRLGFWPPPSLLYECFVAPWEWIGPFRELGLPAGAAVTALLLAGCAWAAPRVAWRALKPALPLALSLAAASIGAFLLARLFPLRFFIPDRYVIHPVHLAYALLLGLAAHAAWRAWVPRRPAAAGAALLLAAASLGAARLHGVGLYDFSPDAPVVAAARALPPDALLAGPPACMDNVLAFGQRRVLASFELAHPWLRGYWAQIEPRLRELFDAYYADDPAAVHAFCSRHGVDFLVVDERDFPPQAGGKPVTASDPRAPDFLQGRPFFAPFDQQIQSLLAGRTHFAVLSPTDFPYSRVDANRRLLDLRHINRRNGL